jgi:hypothetical protein
LTNLLKGDTYISWKYILKNLDAKGVFMNGIQEKQKLESVQGVNRLIGIETKKKLTQKRLKDLLHYDPDTGIFICKEYRGPNAQTGDIAGCVNKQGYGQIQIDCKQYKAHRLAWLYMKGYFPKNINIDHLDRDKTNNKFSNLRLVSQQCNVRNCGNLKNNTSGVKGVHWDNRVGKWRATIVVLNKTKDLGYYNGFSNAVCARLMAEQCLKWEGCNSSSPAYLYVKKILRQVL